MGSGEAQVSMAAQSINTTMNVANTTVQTLMQLMLKEQTKMRNPEALVVDIRDLDKVLNGLNEAVFHGQQACSVFRFMKETQMVTMC